MSSLDIAFGGLIDVMNHDRNFGNEKRREEDSEHPECELHRRCGDIADGGRGGHQIIDDPGTIQPAWLHIHTKGIEMMPTQQMRG